MDQPKTLLWCYVVRQHEPGKTGQAQGRTPLSAQSTVQTPTTARRFTGKGGIAIFLGLALALTSFAAYRAAQAPAPASIPQASAIYDPAQQGVMSYIQTHSAAAPALAADPAQQGVMGYIQTHQLTEMSAATVAAPAADPAQQGVMGYLKAHGAGEPRPAAWEPMVQAVLDYLRAHGWYAD
jgi:hypothetical protein